MVIRNLYGCIILLSICTGILYIYKSLKGENISKRNIFLYFIMFISFTFVFGKLFTIFSSPEDLNIFNAGLSSYGGVIGAILSAIIFEMIVPSNKMIIKYSIIALPLIYGISKVACFTAGCCYGIPYKGLGSISYPDKNIINVFPIQIVETVSFLLIFIICNKLKEHKNIIHITIIISAITKFLLDFLRYDHIYKVITINQIFSLLLVFTTIIIIIYKKFVK